ncbi:MAG TPA: hypothetical protein VJZ32_03950, partial [Candidatus Bathyarchaeia archaeon]|nr:hypothetical protein [Candidatus Bathyarchaeia archaeon]
QSALLRESKTVVKSSGINEQALGRISERRFQHDGTVDKSFLRGRRTVAKSFRIDAQALDGLREEANSQALSLNTIANQLMVNYARFGRYLRRMNGMMLSQQELSEFIQNLSEDSAIKAGKSLGKTSPQMLMAAINGGITVGRVVELIHDLSFCANWFQYTEKRDGERWKITLMHNLGRNWSQFITHYINGAFTAAGCKTKYEVTDRYVTFTI